MDALLGKLSNLAYELFGVIIPGLVFSIFLLLLWFALGDLVPRWTWSRIPAYSMAEFQKVCGLLPGGTAMASATLGLMWLYLCGHALNWASKVHPKESGGWKRRGVRVLAFLKFRTPRAAESYEQKLTPLFDAVNTRFSHDQKPLEWRQFYPLAKSFLNNSDRYSLLSTYQNKYTLHRAIAAGAAALCWLTVTLSAMALISKWRGAEESPLWWALAALFLGALVLITGFSSTFEYNWRLWGDTIVSESYAAIYEPSKGGEDEAK